jgi:hypothetical protein
MFLPEDITMLLFGSCAKTSINSLKCKEGRAMVFNTTFNNISAILWWSVLLEEHGASAGKNP